MKFLICFIAIILINSRCFSQGSESREKSFLELRNSVVAIGTVLPIRTIINGKTMFQKKFFEIGSGLITYLKYDSLTFKNIVTAKHVIQAFIENKFDLYIRPSWADTLKVTEYFGIKIPFVNPDGIPNVYLYPDPHIDLGDILLPGSYEDSFALKKFEESGDKTFPYNHMTVPFLGEQVWICGYPVHIETDFETRFLYNISTFKPGYVAWKPASNFTNVDLNHICLIESNATHGNSGGPVFSMENSAELVGIIVSGYSEMDSVYSNNKVVIDSVTKQPLLALDRSGISVIENAEYVKNLVEYVQVQFDAYIKKYEH